MRVWQVQRAHGGSEEAQVRSERGEMSVARAKRFDVELVSKLDRLGRSVLHLAQLMETFQGLKIGLTAVSQGLEFNPNNPISRMLFTMLSAVAEFERALILERSTAGIQ